jgi:hypothetical protein
VLRAAFLVLAAVARFVAARFLSAVVLRAAEDFLATLTFAALDFFFLTEETIRFFGFRRFRTAFVAFAANVETAPPIALPAVTAASFVTPSPVEATPKPALAVSLMAVPATTATPVAASKPAFAVSAARETIPARFLTKVPSVECSFRA